MPINPYSTAWNNTYQPLGISSLATPLSQMAAQFNAVKTELEDTDYTLSRLSQDDPKAKELLLGYEEEAEQISKELMKDQNYQEAHRKIKRLNKKFAKDMEAQAYKSNYDLKTKLIADADKLLQDEKITDNEYQNWRYNIDNIDYSQGAQYDPTTGKYNKPFNKLPAFSREKEMEDLVLKLAGMTATQKVEYIKNAGILDDGSVAELKEIIEFKDADQMSGEIGNFIKNSDRFRHYLLDKAEYEFLKENDITKKQNIQQGGNPYEYSENIIGNFLNRIEQQAAILEKAIPSAEGRKKEMYKADLESLQETHSTIQSSMQSIQTPEELENYAKQIFKQDKLGYLDRVSAYGADIVDFNRIGKDLTYRQSNETKGKKDKAKELSAGGSVQTMVTSPVEGENQLDIEGLGFGGSTNRFATTGIGSTKQSEEGLKIGEGFVQHMNDTRENVSQGKDYPSYASNYISKSSQENTQIAFENNLFNDKNKQAALNVVNLIDLAGLSTEAKNNLTTNNNKIANLNNQIAKAKSDGDKAKEELLIAEKNKLSEESRENITTFAFQEKILNDIINQVTTFGSNNWDEEQIKKDPIRYELALYKDKKSKYTDASSLLDGILKDNKNLIDFSGERISLDEWENKVSNLEIQLENSKVTGNVDEYNRLKQELETAKKQGILTAFKGDEDAATIVQNKSEEDLKKLYPLEEIFSRYKNLYTIDNYRVSTPTELILDDAANKMTNDIFKNQIKFIKENQQAGTGMVQRITNYNPNTGSSKISDAQSWNLDFYNETPSLAGYSERGYPIYHYVLKNDLAEDKFSSANELAQYISKKKYITSPSKNQSVPGSLAAFYAENPNNLYLEGSKTSMNPKVEAANNFQEMFSGAVLMNSKEGEKIEKQALNNYAPIGLISSPNRGEYQKNAQYLLELASIHTRKNPNDPLKSYKSADVIETFGTTKGSPIMEPPAVWRDLGDGKVEGYGIQYSVEYDDNIKSSTIYSTVIKFTAKDNQITNSEVVDQAPLNYGNNLPLAMFKNNIYYGAGDESDIPVVNAGYGEINFVPAFEKTSFNPLSVSASILAPGQGL